MILGFGINIAEMLIVPIMPLTVGGVLLFSALKRIKSESIHAGTSLKLADYVERLGLLGYAGAALMLIGVLLAAGAFLGILASLI